MGNAAYMYISIAFIQMLKALMVVAVYMFGVLLSTEVLTATRLLNVSVISFGVVVASYGGAPPPARRPRPGLRARAGPSALLVDALPRRAPRAQSCTSTCSASPTSCCPSCLRARGSRWSSSSSSARACASIPSRCGPPRAPAEVG